MSDIKKRAPVQGYSGGIPWAIHLEAYEVYCKRWGPQPALIDLEGRNCRGGFATGELDDFIPGWRERVSEFGLLKAEVLKLRAEAAAVTRAATDVLAERRRQIEVEGWIPEHDDEHSTGALASAAGCYALHAASESAASQYWRDRLEDGARALWPWDDEWFKPGDRRRNLVKAGALILAEIERLDRITG